MIQKTKRILIAEDEKPMSKTLKLKLEKEGLETICAYDGKEAIKLLAEEEIDLLLLDLMLPKMDGFSVLKEMRRKKIKTPVIIISNLGQGDDLNLAKKFGVADYFIKVSTPIESIVKSVKKIFSEDSLGI